MYKEAEYIERCRAKGQDEAGLSRSLAAIGALERDAAGPGGSLADMPIAAVERHVATLVGAGAADEATLLALARYFAVIGNGASAIRLLAYLLPVGVLPTMAARLRKLAGDAAADRVLAGQAFPPAGSPPEAYPPASAQFVEALVSELGHDGAERILLCNVHGIPASAFEADKERLFELGSIDEWLRDCHERLVAELSSHAADGSLWYEQRITEPVVDFVKADQEIQSGVRVGDYIYVKKIPYDPDRFLKTLDAVEKRRLSCHCPLAASSITAAAAGVPAAWCACSAGYVKFRFDVAFGEETDARVLSSVLAGDPICRFSIRIPASATRLIGKDGK